MVAAGALYLAFRGEDIGVVLRLLGGMRIAILVSALGIYIFSQLIFVTRWYMFLRVQSIDIGYWPAVRLHFLGLFYNNCLPSSVGGDLLRAWYVTKHTDKKVEGALSVLVDRVVGLVGLLLMAVGGYWFVPREGRRELFKSYSEVAAVRWVGAHKWAIAGILSGLILAAILLVSSLSGRKRAYRMVARVSQRGADALSKVYRAVQIYYRKKTALLAGLVLTFACQGLFVLALVLFGHELGVKAEAKYYFIFFPISWLLGTLPISPGGGGVVEWVVKVMFVQIPGVSGEEALALALGQRLLWLVGSLPGAVIHLAGRHLPKDFTIDYGQEAE